MKLADVQIGQTYLTKVSGRRVRVLVTGSRIQTSYGHRNAGTVRREVFRCTSLVTGLPLPKGRTAAALTPYLP